jgi:predicted Zn-ribbon and HTH transcriptional regulator
MTPTSKQAGDGQDDAYDTYKCVNCGYVEKIDDLSSIRCPKCHYKGLEPHSEPL